MFLHLNVIVTKTSCSIWELTFREKEHTPFFVSCFELREQGEIQGRGTLEESTNLGYDP